METQTTSEPQVTSAADVQRRSGYKALQAPRRPAYWGVDRDPSRRPGVPMMAHEPRPLPNTRWPPEQQPGEPATPLHGRTNKTLPPVFGTAVPLKGLSGVVRRLAYRQPDHKPSHWLLKILGDRIDSWELRSRRLLMVAGPLAAVALLARRARR